MQSTRGEGWRRPSASFLGPYQVIEELGRGGMGVVYKAFDPKLRRFVALKVLIAGEDASEELVLRFMREAESVARLGHHPHIVPVYDKGCHGQRHYFAMRFVEGRSLDKIEGLTPRRAAQLCQMVARGLAHAHRHGILHRDIKPANIFVDTEGCPSIGDFGIAKDLAADDEEIGGLTRTGTVMGSPAYMPPEQADGDTLRIDERSDVYSLGASLYTVACGRPPFQGETAFKIIHTVLHKDPPAPRKVNPGIEPELESIILKCLEKEPERRYSSADALAEDLERYLTGEPIRARPVTRSRRLRLWVGRNKALAAVSALAAFLFLLAPVGIFVVAPLLEERARARRPMEIRGAAKAALAEEKASMAAMAADPARRSRLGELALRGAVRRRVLDRLESFDLEAGEVGLVDEILDQSDEGGYDGGPWLSRAAYEARNWTAAFRYDPGGPWGLLAQIRMADASLEAREFAFARRLYQRALTGLEARKGGLPKAARRAFDKLAPRARSAFFLAAREQGDLPVIAGGPGSRRALAELSAENQRSAEVASAIAGVRQDLDVGPNATGGTLSAIELLEFAPSQNQSDLIYLTRRRSDVAFRASEGQLVREPSPLRSLARLYTIYFARTADLDGDGRKEIIAAIGRGREYGYATLRQEGAVWRPEIQLGVLDRPNCMAMGDDDGDGRDEVYLAFDFRANLLLRIEDTGGRVLSRPLTVPGGRNWATALVLSDLDADGRAEILLGSDASVSASVLVCRWRGRLELVSGRVFGQAKSTVVTRDGLIASLTHLNKQFANTPIEFEGELENGLVLTRFRDGELQLLRRHSFGISEARTRDCGTIVAGRWGGEPVLAWFTKLRRELPRPGLDEERDDEGEEEDDGLTVLGQRLQFLKGDPEAEPVTLNLKARVQDRFEGLRFFDLDGDGDTELLVLMRDGPSSRLIVHDRESSKAKDRKPSGRKPGKAPQDAELLRGAARDLLRYRAFDQARSLLETIARKHPAFAAEARWQGARSYLLQAKELLRVKERRAGPEDLDRQKTAFLEACLKGLDRVAALLKERGDRGLEAERLLALRFEFEASLERWESCAETADRIAEANPYLWMTRGRRGLRSLKTAVIEPETALEGELVADLPLRARVEGKALTLEIDPHSRRHVAGIPVFYDGKGPFEFAMSFKLGSGPWAMDGALGLVRREDFYSAKEGPGDEEAFLSTPGTLRYRFHNLGVWRKTGLRFTTFGTKVYAPWTEERRLRFVYVPQARLMVFELFDSQGRLLHRSQKAAAEPPPKGRYVFGVMSRYFGDPQAFLNNPAFTSLARLRLRDLSLRGGGLRLDDSGAASAASLLQSAGGCLVKGEADRARSLYREALSRDARSLSALLHYGLLADQDSAILAGLRSDPYGFLLMIDDALRGAPPRYRKRLGALLARCAKRDPELAGYCAALAGERQRAARLLTKTSDGERYARLRAAVPLGDDYSSLTRRGLRTPGNELQEVFWSGAPLGALSGGDKHEAWFWLSKRLCAEEASRGLRIQRANLALKSFGLASQAWRELRAYAELDPDDPKGWATLASFLARNYDEATIVNEALSELSEAERAAHIKRPEFQRLRERGELE